MQPDSREVAALIIDLVFHTPRIDADTPLEEIHLLESVADILEEAFDEVEGDREDAMANEQVIELEKELDWKLDEIATDQEIIAKQQVEIGKLVAQNDKLKRKIKRLEKRLLEKKAFETEDLIQRGATPQFIQKINRKDAEAMAD